jgi:hypothetical protein
MRINMKSAETFAMQIVRQNDRYRAMAAHGRELRRSGAEGVSKNPRIVQISWQKMYARTRLRAE